MAKVKLNSGHFMPTLGLGTWQSKPDEVKAAVIYAIEAGYRHIDCARIYMNEAEVGAAIKAKIADGTVRREDLFITTKLWNNAHRRDLVVPQMKKSLSELGLDYVDLYLIHFPVGFQPGDSLLPRTADGQIILDNETDLADTWKGMEDVARLELAKSIGVSNFSKKQLEHVLNSAKIPIAVNQVEMHPYFPQQKLVEFCKDKGIVITAYSPFASPNHAYARPDDPLLLEEPKLIEIGKKYGKGPNHVVLQWLLQKGVVAIPKSVTKSRIEDNFKLGFTLTEGEMREVEGLDRGKEGRVSNWPQWSGSKDYPYNDEY